MPASNGWRLAYPRRVDYEKGKIDTDPNIFYINLPETESILSSDPFRQVEQATLPRDPHYTISEEGWKKVLVPVVGAAMGAAFLVQGIFFTKQLIEGEKEFEE
jgi:hypothetical protein